MNVVLGFIGIVGCPTVQFFPDLQVNIPLHCITFINEDVIKQSSYWLKISPRTAFELCFSYDRLPM